MPKSVDPPLFPADYPSESTLEVTISRDMRSLLRSEGPQQALLIVLSGPRLGNRVVVAEETVEIGRGSGSALILDVDSVSRHHAKIDFVGDKHVITDVGSTNGSYVNGARIREHVLRDGDRVQIGKALLKYVAGGNIESAYHEEVQRLMHYDGLTGIYNKRHFEESLRLAIFATRTKPKPISLIVFDIDHFKLVNDTHGHMAGDAVLCDTANVVKSSIPAGFVFGRVGGEEFAVLCEGAGLARALECAEEIRAAVGDHRPVFEGKELPVTVSLGVAERLVSSAEEAEALYGRADDLLYVAKSAGRNCVRS